MTVAWEKVRDYTDIIFEKAEGIGKITINRPEVRNAFRPETLTELIDAFTACREDPEIGVVIFTGAGDSSVLLWRGSACSRSWRLCRRRWRASPERARLTEGH